MADVPAIVAALEGAEGAEGDWAHATAALLRHKEEDWENLAAEPCEGLRRMGQALRNGRA